MDHVLNRRIAFDQIRESLTRKDFRKAISLFLELHPGDQVEIFEELDLEEQTELLSRLNISDIARLFSHQEDSDTLQAAESLSIEKLADVLDKMEPDEAADLLGDLPPEQAAEAIEQMEELEEVLPLLNYPDETAGGRMTTDFISLKESNTTSEAIEILRHVQPENEVPYYLYVTDKQDHLHGILGLRELVISPADQLISMIMDEEVIQVPAMMDQEEVAQIMVQYDLSALPVVDSNKKLLGVITHDDILDVIQEEATEDIYRLSNVSDSDIEPNSTISEQLRGRLPWLFLNMLTALFAAWVISNFERLIAQVAALAIFQSVVAGLGGNSASQSVAMFVRAMALGNISGNNTLRLLFRQMIVGLAQGIAIGSVVGFGVILWRGDVYLGLVLAFALVGNMLLAGIVGTLIPMGLKSIGQDPALASSVLVTAFTDSLGFFIFLSLAQLFRGRLIL